MEKKNNSNSKKAHEQCKRLLLIVFHHQLSIPLPAQTWFLFVSPHSEKADSVPRHPMSRPRVGRCCPDQEGNGVPVTTEQTVPSPFPNGRHCWSQNTELHAEVRGTSIQKKTPQPWVHLVTNSAFHVKLFNVIKIARSQFQSSCPGLYVPWPSLCSPKPGLHFPKRLLSPKPAALGPSVSRRSCLWLNSQTSPSECPGNSYIQVTKSCVYFG